LKGLNKLLRIFSLGYDESSGEKIQTLAKKPEKRRADNAPATCALQ
jgi:hypothetical protein